MNWHESTRGRAGQMERPPLGTESWHNRPSSPGQPGWKSQVMSAASSLQQEQPGFVQPIAGGGRKRSKVRGWQVVVLCVLAVLVVGGVVLGPMMLRALRGRGNMGGGTMVNHQGAPEIMEQLSDIQRYKYFASRYVTNMSLDEELGQLLMVQYESDYYSDDLDTMINQQHVGGVIVYENGFLHQLRTGAQAKADIAHMQQRAKVPLLISIDQEGVGVCRLCAIYPGHYLDDVDDAYDIWQTGDPGAATREGHKIAQDMKALGINVDLAPDVDVAENYAGSYIGHDYRSFGQTPDEVIKYTVPFVEALQGDGVIGALKHFPGLGSVRYGDDPHGTLPTVTKTKDELEKTDLVPFKHFIESSNPVDQPGFIMSTDELVPALDKDYPAEFSHAIITDLLRNELGYDGAIISDSVIMGGVRVHGVQLTEAQASLLAIQAGEDMVLCVDGSDQVTDVINTLKDALQKGTLTKQRVDEAAIHILTLKMQYHVIPVVPAQ